MVDDESIPFDETPRPGKANTLVLPPNYEVRFRQLSYIFKEAMEQLENPHSREHIKALLEEAGMSNLLED